jgi:hypothetical protein
MLQHSLFILLWCALASPLLAQANFVPNTNNRQPVPQRWQQRADYFMEIDLDVNTHRYQGKQKLIYYNNSNEVLSKVFYHLYFNAFQPGSNMDEQSRTISDPDFRVSDRISKLKPEEQGYIKVKSLSQNGKAVSSFETNETILEVNLNKPIEPGEKVEFYMEYEAQVPIQIRRSGRDSKEGIRYSMTQWYPKMCEFDEQGWHANPYVGREFYGIWGDFDVKITLDKTYVLGGTGYLMNANEIGHGYQDVGKKVNYKGKDKLTWHFVAPNVHDFAWAADPDYLHEIVEINDTMKVHLLFQDDPAYKSVWYSAIQEGYIKRMFKFIQNTYGAYPYRQYTIIQGGDGGMEYPMATLITGNRNKGSLIGVIVHELMHTWYQMLMGTNESLYAWMDEGFTSYASNVVMQHLGLNHHLINIHNDSYKGYFTLAQSGAEEPMTTHADHYQSNFAYGQAAYSKGAVFLHQLEYIIGKANLDTTLLDYYYTWRFRHPNANDFIRVAERVSNLELDWYKEYWVNTTHTIDYGINEVKFLTDTSFQVSLNRVGKMIMPLDVVVEYLPNPDSKEVKTYCYHIPLDLMRGAKPNEQLYSHYTILPDWYWTHKNYTFVINLPMKNIKSIQIDPTQRMADIKRENNMYQPK